jgi:mRNA-degrading endonuclease toxin of MazEF toxin-antitoxin module
MNYRKGDIVIVKFPFVRLNRSIEQKGRPALVLSDEHLPRRYQDIILAAISSQLPANIMDLEMLIEPTKATGLVKTSLLRLDFLMTIPEELVSRKIGKLPGELLSQTESKLKSLFGIQ